MHQHDPYGGEPCGEEYADVVEEEFTEAFSRKKYDSGAQMEAKMVHLVEEHNVAACNFDTFFRGDNFREHLRHHHDVIGDWANILPTLCMID